MGGAEDTPSRPSTPSASATGEADAKLRMKKKKTIRLNFMIRKVLTTVG